MPSYEMSSLYVCALLVCLFVNNKRQNCWTDLVQILCRTSQGRFMKLRITESSPTFFNFRKIFNIRKKIVNPKNVIFVLAKSKCFLNELLFLLCRLARIDSRLLKLVNLTELDMAGNEIELVPDNFDSLPSLTQLNLADNQISSLPRDIGHFIFNSRE